MPNFNVKLPNWLGSVAAAFEDKPGKLLLLSGLSLLIGCSALTYGLYKNVAIRSMYTAPDEFSTSTTRGLVCMSIGCINIVIGIWGLVTALVPRARVLCVKVLAIIHVVLLTFCVIGNAVFMVMYTMESFKFIREETVATKQAVIENFGRQTDRESNYFTAAIELIQKRYECCGWSDNAEENVYTQTPWAMKNITDLNLPKTFPETCCVPAKVLACSRTRSLRLARQLKYIHKTSCLYLVINEYSFVMWIIIVQLSISIIVHVISIVCTVIYIVQTYYSK